MFSLAVPFGDIAEGYGKGDWEGKYLIITVTIKIKVVNLQSD